jgi:hypothetical protein
MRLRLKRSADRGKFGSERAPAGEDLIGSVTIEMRFADAAWVRASSHAVAQALRAGEASALPAFAALLVGAQEAAVSDSGATTNLLSGLHFASMMSADQRGGWAPPSLFTDHLLTDAVSGGSEALREQAEGVLWALVDHEVLGAWTTPEGIRRLAGLVEEPELSEKLLAATVREDGSLVRLVSVGEEFPCVAA